MYIIIIITSINRLYIPPEITISTVVSVYHNRVGRSPTPAGNGPRSAGTAKPGSRRGLDGAFMALL